MPTKSSTYKVQVKGQTITTLNLNVNGMIPFPVKVYTPYNDDSGSGLKKGCPKCLSQVEQPPHCSNEKCAYHKGFPEHIKTILFAEEGTEKLTVSEEDLEGLDLPSNKEFRVEAIAPFKDVEHLTYYATGLYYTAPANAVSAILYHTLLKNLRTSKRVIMGKFILKSNARSETLGMLRVLGDCLVIQMVPFASQRRELPIFELPEITRRDNERLEDILSDLPDEFIYTDAVDEWKATMTQLLQDKLRAKLGKGGQVRRKKAKDAIEIAATADARDQLEALYGKAEVSRKVAKRPTSRTA